MTHPTSIHPYAKTIGLVGWLLITFAAAALGNIATSSGLGQWYQNLAKPSLTPPDWVFGPVWTVLYVMMAVAAWLVWQQKGFYDARWPLVIFLLQLALNTFWSVLFFGWRSPGLAAVEIVVLWLAIAATLVSFWRRSVVAAMFLLPYLAWVTFAALLNFQIAWLNA